MEKPFSIHEDRKELEQFILKKEPEANRKIGFMYYILSVLLFFTWLAVVTGFFSVNSDRTGLFFICTILLSFGVGCICFANDGKGVWKKYLIILTLLIIVFSVNLFFSAKVMILFCLPILITCRYSNIKLTAITFVISSLLVALCLFISVYAAYELNSVNLNIAAPNPFNYSGKTTLSEAVLRTGIIPEQTLEAAMKTIVFPTIAVLLTVMFVCLVVIKYNRRLMLAIIESTRRETRMQLDVANSRSKIMLSQIRPHFIYNSLSAIMAIDGNPDETVEALSIFSSYLRENLNSLTDKDTVSFYDELEHVKKYVTIEKFRFQDDLNVEYDIGCVDFSLPTLSVQVLVENAVKHGVMMKENGGTVKITSGENENSYTVTITDDGVGFDVNSLTEKGDSIGINNVKMRLETLCNGKLTLQSEPQKGTTAIIEIPKTV